MRQVEWAKMTAPELKTLAHQPNSLAILPAGALEQHGPHLPVITDTVSASAASIAAAERVSDNTAVAVLPGLWLGMSEHHLPFGGTISLDSQTYRAVVVSIVRSLKTLGFSRLLIVNGHGGNIDVLSLVARELAVEFAMPIVSTMPWLLVRPDVGTILETDAPGHACEGETSIMLATYGDYVQQDKFELAAPSAANAVRPFPGFNRFHSFAERAPQNGTLGDPRLATAAKGHKILEMQAEALAAAIQNDALWTPPDLVWNQQRI